ncbi:manganese efflux pump MntP [Butyrivibrio sp. NC2002]|uniref:manganese efflux pump MntP n=1 Tax=Butyrivibrio sp. NC2002 TaxID=1410610 RepID=UPI00055DCE5C|nr:manganese efflux pump [Butyrivibrio sp. NC2002]
MNNLIIFFINSTLLGVGLAMDAFSVSVANALSEPAMKLSRKRLVAGTFAFFQFLMPLIGWMCVVGAASAFAEFQKFIPWIALILLLFIGGKMLKEGIFEQNKVAADELENEIESGKISTKMLMVQGIATSIDALSVGFTISDHTFKMAFFACLIIAVVTYFICRLGLKIGAKFGLKLAGRATIIGGIILIGIGIEIFVRGIFGI